jgi:hypothetical protein
MKLSLGAKGHAKIKSGDQVTELDYRVLDKDVTGNAEIALAAIGWPKGATARFVLTPLNRDSHWKLDAPKDLADAWKESLGARYCLGIAVVRFPEKAADAWKIDEDQPPLHTHYAYKVLSRDGDQVKISVHENTRADGNAAEENIEGELAYDLTRPLPVGWLSIQSKRSDGAISQTRYDYGN